MSVVTVNFLLFFICFSVIEGRMLLLQPLKALLDDVCWPKSSLKIDGAIFCRRIRKWLSKKTLMKYQQWQLNQLLKCLAQTAANSLSHERASKSDIWL